MMTMVAVVHRKVTYGRDGRERVFNIMCRRAASAMRQCHTDRSHVCSGTSRCA